MMLPSSFFFTIMVMERSRSVPSIQARHSQVTSRCYLEWESLFRTTTTTVVRMFWLRNFLPSPTFYFTTTTEDRSAQRNWKLDLASFLEKFLAGEWVLRILITTVGRMHLLCRATSSTMWKCMIVLYII